MRCSYIHQISYQEVESSSCNVATKPRDIRECGYGRCDAAVHWRVGAWSQCSTSCGPGQSFRHVQCTDRVSQTARPDAVCSQVPSFRPDRMRSCEIKPCVPSSCYNVKLQLNRHDDGDYFIQIKNKITKVSFILISTK